jgi:hypothetical protein
MFLVARSSKNRGCCGGVWGNSRQWLRLLVRWVDVFRVVRGHSGCGGVQGDHRFIHIDQLVVVTLPWIGTSR